MQKLWFITNPGSGSTTQAKCDALEAVFEERGLALVGRTEFPAAEDPERDVAHAQAGRHRRAVRRRRTINAALCALAKWKGAFLILPGGTMNLLAKTLHGASDPHAILSAAHASDRRISLPYVEAGGHRAFVGADPRARDRLGARARGGAQRQDRPAGAGRRGSRGAAPSRRGGIRIEGAPGLGDRYQAVFVTPGREGARGRRGRCARLEDDRATGMGLG